VDSFSSKPTSDERVSSLEERSDGFRTVWYPFMVLEKKKGRLRMYSIILDLVGEGKKSGRSFKSSKYWKLKERDVQAGIEEL